ncbi:hypothetical protein BDZ94DRAFT_1274297 [Collybia nuda]|uniref:Uncharacterized protein n=1 Tax=Collybia nuda TaxID=64659 RepID=A0A9P6CDG7_9AGAR|nr:hypothetical protein BDZ94DRAFT_1274297 [Collybia nuda]
MVYCPYRVLLFPRYPRHPQLPTWLPRLIPIHSFHLSLLLSIQIIHLLVLLTQPSRPVKGPKLLVL